MKMKFKIGFLASLPLTTDTELVATTVKFQQSSEKLERVGGKRERDQSRACLQTVADETGQEDEPRTRHCRLPRPAEARVCADLQCYKSHSASDGDGSTPRGRSSSTSSSESSNTNSGDSISFDSTNSSGSTFSTGNSFASSSAHNSDSTGVKPNNIPGKRLFTFGPKNEIRKRRIEPRGDTLASEVFAAAAATTTTTCLEFSVNGNANNGGSVIKAVNLKTNSLSSNSSYESQTSSNSSTKSFRNFFHRGNVFSSSLKMRNSINKKSNKNKIDNNRKGNSTITTTTINDRGNNNNLTQNSRFLLPADSVTNIVVVGDKGVGKSAITVRFLTRRYIGEYSSDSEMMYQHDTTVDHAPACLQLLDVTTMQTPYQILNHLSWAHAFVVVYDITSRTSFIHARQLLHILHSCFHTHPHLSPQFGPHKASDFAARPNMPHECVRNVSRSPYTDSTMYGDCAFSDEEISQPLLPIISAASRPPHSLHNPTQGNHQAYSRYQADPPPTSQGYFIQAPLPVSSQGRREPATHACHCGHRPITNRQHRGATPCYGFARSDGGDRHLTHCPRHSTHTTLPHGTTFDNYESNYNKSSFVPSHIYCDSSDTIVPDNFSFDNIKEKSWPPDKVRRTPVSYQRNFESCERRQKSECVYERYASRPSFHHSYNRLHSGQSTFAHQDGLPPRESCYPTSPLRKHTTLLLGNKRDLEHIRRVWTDEGEALSLEFSCQFYEVSAAESVLGIHLAFHSLLKEARALQLIRSLPRENAQSSAKGTVSSAVSKAIGNFFRTRKVEHKSQSNSI